MQFRSRGVPQSPVPPGSRPQGPAGEPAAEASSATPALGPSAGEPPEPHASPEPRGTAAERLLVVGALASSLVHDLRDVLTALMGFAQLLGDEVAPRTPAGAYARHILRAGQHGQVLTERLAGYARRGRGGRARLDLRGVVDVAVDLARPLLGRRVRLCVEHAPGDLAVWADPDDLEQVVLTLVLNARDALPVGGRIGLTTERLAPRDGEVEGGVALRIEDNGLALAPEALAPSTEPTGALSLRRLDALLRRNGGRLLASTDPVGGNRFELRLPFAA